MSCWRTWTCFLVPFLIGCPKETLRTVSVVVVDADGAAVPDAKLRIWPEGERARYESDHSWVNVETGVYSVDILHGQGFESWMVPGAAVVVEASSPRQQAALARHTVVKQRGANEIRVTLEEVEMPALPERPIVPEGPERDVSTVALAEALDSLGTAQFDEASERAKVAMETAHHQLSGAALEQRVADARLVRTIAEYHAWDTVSRRMASELNLEGLHERQARAERVQKLAVEMLELGVAPEAMRHLCRASRSYIPPQCD